MKKLFIIWAGLLVLPYLAFAGTLPVIPWQASSYPTDPTADIPWSCGVSGVDQIQCAFNNARSTENAQLGTSLPILIIPSQATWDAMSDGEKALWLINRERSDRGIHPLDQVESNVTEVAQTYANYLLDNDTYGHFEDGRSPWERLEDNPEIWACHDFLNVAENLSLFVSTGTIPLSVERSVYMWMYDDAGSSWGHRHTVLWYPYNDNNGLAETEGFLGIGRASGGPYQGPFSTSWPFAELIVMNVFDPCSTWGDIDADGIPDEQDNCPTNSNTDQTDTYPPFGGNGIGDACDCEADFDCDGDADGTDASTFKLYFGRSPFYYPCNDLNPCHGDFDCDVDVDGTDAALFKLDFGRSGYINPCPACVVGEWCVYE